MLDGTRSLLPVISRSCRRTPLSLQVIKPMCDLPMTMTHCTSVHACGTALLTAFSTSFPKEIEYSMPMISVCGSAPSTTASMLFALARHRMAFKATNSSALETMMRRGMPFGTWLAKLTHSVGPPSSASPGWPFVFPKAKSKSGASTSIAASGDFEKKASGTPWTPPKRHSTKEECSRESKALTRR